MLRSINTRHIAAFVVQVHSVEVAVHYDVIIPRAVRILRARLYLGHEEASEE